MVSMETSYLRMYRTTHLYQIFTIGRHIGVDKQSFFDRWSDVAMATILAK